MEVSIQIPDEVGRALAARPSDVRRAVPEAVVVEGYRTGAITDVQIEEMLGLC